MSATGKVDVPPFKTCYEFVENSDITKGRFRHISLKRLFKLNERLPENRRFDTSSIKRAYRKYTCRNIKESVLDEVEMFDGIGRLYNDVTGKIFKLDREEILESQEILGHPLPLVQKVMQRLRDKNLITETFEDGKCYVSLGNNN